MDFLIVTDLQNLRNFYIFPNFNNFCIISCAIIPFRDFYIAYKERKSYIDLL